ncbi:MAG: MFS transporter, partial [Flavobacteriales bacterium]|nr:MFS transporter [Flavobacteriales bacterium]
MKKQAALGFIFVTALIDIIGIGLIIPIMPDLIQEVTGLAAKDPKVARLGGLLITIYAVMQFIFAPILGGLSDKFGRKPVLLIAMFGFAIDYIIIALAPTMVWLFIARVISGICGSSLTVANAYIADISRPEERAKNFGMIGAAFGVGFVIGPALGGLLGEIGTRIPFYVAAGLSVLNFIYGWILVPESLHKEDRREFSWKRANPLGTLVRIFSFKTIIGLLVCLMFIYVAAHATH